MDTRRQPTETQEVHDMPAYETEIALSQEGRQGGMMSWWHKLVSPPDLPQNATVLQREAHRRAHTLSTIIFFFLPVMILALPITFFIPEPYVPYIVILVIVACLVSLLCNRTGHVLIAGIILTF